MHITIYIRKELEEKFKAEPNKSDLINQLLAKYYLGNSGKSSNTVRVSETAIKPISYKKTSNWGA